MAPGKSRASKASFFAALETLDDSDDAQHDEDISLQHILAASRPPILNISKENAEDEPVNPEPPFLIRANIESHSMDRAASDLSEPQRGPHRRTGPADPEVRLGPVKRSYTTGNLPTMSRASSTKKRKVDVLRAVPEGQQVFKGLVFCMLHRTLPRACD